MDTKGTSATNPPCSELSVHSFDGTRLRIEVLVNPLPHFLIALIIRVPENLQQIVIAGNAPTVFRRTRRLPIQAEGDAEGARAGRNVRYAGNTASTLPMAARFSLSLFWWRATNPTDSFIRTEPKPGGKSEALRNRVRQIESWFPARTGRPGELSGRAHSTSRIPL